MELQELQQKIKEFDRKISWDKTEFKQLIQFMEEELDHLKQTDPQDKQRINHLLTDMLVLIVQASYRYNTDFNAELEKWFKENNR